MAIMTVNFLSKELFRTVTMNVILPVDKLILDPNQKVEQKPFKTLYLLHGLLGNHTDWISGTRIQRWAEEKNLAVVMPGGENGFYLDQVGIGRNYGKFIGEELVEMTRKMFPLSDKREDTFIGGLSMGGFGAMRNGLKYADTFGYIISLSGALHILEDPADTKTGTIGGEESSFGNLEEAKTTDRNPKWILDQFEVGDKKLPSVFLACGTEDSLIYTNRLYKRYLEEKNENLKYIEKEGNHNWDFWDEMIKEALDWLPLDDGKQGINSGNVDVKTK